jgi:dynein-related subfamily AAA family protein
LVQLKKVRRKIEALKSGKIYPEYKEFPQIFRDIEEKFQEEFEEASLEELRDTLRDFTAQSTAPLEYEDMKSVEEKFSRVMAQRRRFSKEFNGEELEAREWLEKLRDRIREEEFEIKKNIQNRLEKQWVAVETAFEEMYSVDQLEKAHELSELVRMEELFDLIEDKDVLRDWRRRLTKLKTQKRNQIRAKENEEKDREKQRARDLVDSIMEDLNFIDDELDTLHDEKAVNEYQEKSALVGRIRTRLQDVDTDLKKDIWGQVKRLFLDRKNELKTREKVQDTEKQEAFGFPIFVPEEPRIDVVIQPLNRKAKRGTLIFRDNLDKEWAPSVGSIPIDKTDEESREIIELYRDDAKYELFGEEAERVRPLVPPMHKEWVLSDQTETYLRETGRLLNKQLKRQNGVLVLVGEAGTGKNVLADMFGHFTNREVFEFSCNKQAEKEDVQFSFEFDPKKGTYKVASNVIQALQTPGAVLVFDEINTLPPGVSKLLNPLFDHRRKLIMPDGTVIKAHPSVVILGMMNPGNYIGTNPLPQEVRSRARIKTISYPTEAADEGVMYSPLFSSLQDLNSTEFHSLWKKVVNGEASPEADKVENEDRKQDLIRLKEMIRIGNLMREKYRETQLGTASAGDEVNFIFSLRDGGQVVEELDDNSDLTVKEAMKSIILPKIDDPEEEHTLKVLIDNA